jgi:hypothetical protein
MCQDELTIDLLDLAAHRGAFLPVPPRPITVRRWHRSGARRTAKVEYPYVDLGSVSATVPDFAPGTVVILNSDVRDHVARIGLNYRFGGPVVARY